MKNECTSDKKRGQSGFSFLPDVLWLAGDVLDLAVGGPASNVIQLGARTHLKQALDCPP